MQNNILNANILRCIKLLSGVIIMKCHVNWDICLIFYK